MTNLQLVSSNPNQNQTTMSSLEIAELCEKRHDNVMADIRKMLKELGIDATEFSGAQTYGNNNTREVFNLPRRECDILVAGYNIKYRAAIIDRWHELESKQAPALPQTYLEALEQLVEKEKRLIEQAPKVAFVENLVERDSLMTATQVGQKHKISAVKLNKILDSLNVYNKSVKRSRAFKQWFIDGGYGEMKQTEAGYSQALFTNAGEIWINEQLISEGIV